MSLVSSGYGSASSFGSLEKISIGYSLPRSFERIVQFLGQGGFGRVYKSRSLFKKEYAVKVNRNETKKEQADNQHEAQILQKIYQSGKCEYLVKSSRQFSIGNEFVIHMELLDESLNSFLEGRGRSNPLNGEVIASLFEQILKATSDLYDIGFVHGDIKFENILLCKDRSKGMRIKLADYGLSTPVGEISSFRSGTYGYSAPELSFGLPATERIDSWSIGVVLFGLYTNYVLFTGDDVYQYLEEFMELFVIPAELMAGAHFNSYFQKNPMAPPGFEYELLVPSDAVSPDKMYVQNEEYLTVQEMLDDASLFHEDCSVRTGIQIRKFVQLLLTPSPSKRMTPKQALEYWEFCSMNYY